MELDKILQMAMKLAEDKGGLWDALEGGCCDPKNCDIPYEMHREYWLELAAKKLRMN